MTLSPAYIRKSSKQNQFTVARVISHSTAGQSKGIQYDNIDPTLDDAGVPVTLAIWGVYLTASIGNQGMMFIDQTASDADDGCSRRCPSRRRGPANCGEHRHDQ